MIYPGDNIKQWFVMRDLRRSNSHETAYQLLMQHGYEAFTPMTVAKNSHSGKREMVPLLHWLVFLHATKTEIDTIIAPPTPLITRLQYCYERGKPIRYGGMVVSDSAMNYFRIALAKEQMPVVYRYSDITPEMRGRRVLVTHGEMAGYYGHIQKYTGGRNMRLFVELEGYCSIPIQISPEDVQVLDNTSGTTHDETHYIRLARMADIISFLRFTVPSVPKEMSDAQLTEVSKAYALATQLLDEYHFGKYLCIDEVCHDRRDAIRREVERRAIELTLTDETPLLDRMRQLCQQVRSA